MARRLPFELQKLNIKNKFCKNYPDECDLIDFDAVMDRTLTYQENVETLRSEYPQYRWNEEPKITARTYEKEFISDLKEQAGQYSYDVVKKYKLSRLEGAENRAIKLKEELDKCLTERVPRRKRKPIECKEEEKFWVPGYYRCPRK